MSALNFGPLAAYTGIPREAVAPTLAYLRMCQRARLAGYPVSYADDPTWLAHMAINRRASWPDDPAESRGSCQAVNGLYPRRAQGSEYMRAWRLAHAVNSRVRVSEREARQVLGKHAGRVRTYGTDDV